LSEIEICKKYIKIIMDVVKKIILKIDSMTKIKKLIIKKKVEKLSKTYQKVVE
jgi:hypothetical protein